MRNLKLFSADDHIIEPAHVWQTRVPAAMRDRAPHVVEEDGLEYWEYEDQRGTTMGLNAVAGQDHRAISPDPVRFSDMMLGAYDPTQRAKDMLADGVLASVLFPTLPRFAGTLFLDFEDKDLAHACVRAYNDYVIEEWCPAGPPGLFVPTVITTLWDPVAAAAEIHRCADLGARALSFPENSVPLGLPSYWDESWNPVWQACQDRDVVLCLHIGTSGEVPKPTPEAPAMLSFTLLQVGSIISSVNLMMSPVCRAYPDLKFVFSEGGIGWLPNAIERADRMWLRHKHYSGLDDVLPSEVFRRNMYLCMIEEPVCLKYRHDIGVDRIMWECDYPHTDSTWPDSQRTANEVFDAAGVPDDEVEAISYGNAERVFNWNIADPELAFGTAVAT
jgi:predicted TIM-barrel fold metal-dependent hydrolase